MKTLFIIIIHSSKLGSKKETIKVEMIRNGRAISMMRSEILTHVQNNLKK